LSFSDLGLDPELLKGVEEMGWDQPTEIQTEAIPHVLERKDLIGCAQTGTGKTAAFALPMMQLLGRGPTVRGLILVPTRELCIQVYENFAALSQYSTIRVVQIYGGVPIPPQEAALRDGVDVIVATPGRLLDHIQRRNTDLHDVEMLVLDEADRMLDMGFSPEINRILKMLPKRRQSMLFSATIPPEIKRLADRVLWEPIEVTIGRKSTPAEGITETIYRVLQSEKDQLLVCLLDKLERGPTLIFCRTRRGSDRVAIILERLGFKVTAMHADRTQAQRQAALEGFRAGRFEVLVATDIAARGLDINGITHVINFDTPEYPDDYVHRIGRTARAEAEGDAITFVDPWEESFLAAIQKFTEREIPWENLPEDYMSYEIPKPPRKRPGSGDHRGGPRGGGRPQGSRRPPSGHPRSGSRR